MLLKTLNSSLISLSLNQGINPFGIYIYIYIAKLSTPKIWLALSQTFSSGVLWLGFNKFLREIWGEKIANSNGFRLKQLKKSSLLIFPSESVSNSAKSLWTWEGTRFAETAWRLTIWNYGWIKNINNKNSFTSSALKLGIAGATESWSWWNKLNNGACLIGLRNRGNHKLMVGRRGDAKGVENEIPLVQRCNSFH